MQLLALQAALLSLGVPALFGAGVRNQSTHGYGAVVVVDSDHREVTAIGVAYAALVNVFSQTFTPISIEERPV